MSSMALYIYQTALSVRNYSNGVVQANVMADYYESLSENVPLPEIQVRLWLWQETIARVIVPSLIPANSSDTPELYLPMSVSHL